MCIRDSQHIETNDDNTTGFVLAVKQQLGGLLVMHRPEELERVRELLEQVLKVSESRPTSKYGRKLSSIGTIFMTAGHLKDAIDHFQRSLEVKETGQFYSKLGRASWQHFVQLGLEPKEHEEELATIKTHLIRGYEMMSNESAGFSKNRKYLVRTAKALIDLYAMSDDLESANKWQWQLGKMPSKARPDS